MDGFIENLCNIEILQQRDSVGQFRWFNIDVTLLVNSLMIPNEQLLVALSGLAGSFSSNGGPILGKHTPK